MKADVLNSSGVKSGEIELADEVFGIVPNESVIHESIVAYLANQRRGTKSALTRAEVSGGGAKPWRQKGTGHARQGSTRAPQWRHGGIVFAPKPRDYSVVLNKKVKNLAIRSVLSQKAKTDNLLVLEDFNYSLEDAPLSPPFEKRGERRMLYAIYRTYLYLITTLLPLFIYRPFCVGLPLSWRPLRSNQRSVPSRSMVWITGAMPVASPSLSP